MFVLKSSAIIPCLNQNVERGPCPNEMGGGGGAGGEGLGSVVFFRALSGWNFIDTNYFLALFLGGKV